MSTHNIGFYEDLTKKFFESSSNTHLISSAGIEIYLPFYLFFAYISKKQVFSLRLLCVITIACLCHLQQFYNCKAIKFSVSPHLGVPNATYQFSWKSDHR